jgi:multiple sugar transport system substrate-binding protein
LWSQLSAALAATTGGLTGILSTGRAPAVAQASSLHLLRIGDFVPASDTLLRNDLLVEAEKSLGIKVKLEGINGNDLQARITSGIQSGTGADIIVGLHNWPQLYSESLADVSDVAEEVGKSQGGYHALFETLAKSDRDWLAVPWCALGIAVTYRKSWFDEVGYANFPETWEQYRDAGKKLKSKGRPIGQTLGHTYNDAPAFTDDFGLFRDAQRMISVDHRLALSNPALVSAPSKKSFSSVSSPILA